MARARNIKPGFYANEDLAECSVWARFIFPGLWMMADREGRLEYRPKKIKGELLRYDNQDADPLLLELQAHGFILIYEAEGKEFIQIIKFSMHQNPHHREVDSVIPPPKSLGLSMVSTRSKPEADDSYHDDLALGEPEADMGLQGGSAVLIPDSGFLIPDSTPSAPSKKILLDAGGKWDGIPDNLSTTWREAYPAVDVKAELAKAAAWIIANPKNKKSNYARFLTNWLTRAQDGAKRTGGGPSNGNGQSHDARYVN